jgi:acyl-CoA dehydrogenase
LTSHQGGHSPYYRESHHVFRAKVRAFVESELIPHMEEWIDSEEGYPLSLHKKA